MGALPVGGIRREDTIGQLPQARSLGLVVDYLCAKRLATELDIGMDAKIVELGWVLGQAEFRGDDRDPLAVVEVDDSVTPQLPGTRASRLQQCGWEHQTEPSRPPLSRRRKGSSFQTTLRENHPTARVPTSRA
jgi:hypothetical protein